MATKTKQWPDGSSATIQYGGQGDGEIIITSEPNSLYEARSMQITVGTTDGSDIQKTITINQAAKQRIDISAAVVTAATQTYSGSAKTPTPTVTLNGSTVPSSGYDVAYNNNTNAGTATITITGKGDYTGTASGTFTIAPAAPSYTAPTAKTLTYSGSSQALVNAGNSSDGTFTYKLSTASSYGSSIPTGTNAGSYTVNWKFVADANHGGGTFTGNVSVTISQKSLTITAKAQSINYGNSIATGTSQVTTSGLVSGDSLTAITLTASTSNVTTSGTITPSAASTTKGISNYDVTYSTGNLTITAVPASVTAAPTAKSLTYNRGSQSLVNAGTASGGTMYYYATTTNSKPSSTSSFSSSIPTKTNAGTYYVWYYVKGDSNHTDTSISSTSVSVTISKATPVISTAPSKRTGLAYTGSAQNLLSSGSVKHSSSDSTSVSGTFTYAQGTNAGTYSSLTWSFAPSSSSNYNSISGTVSGSVTIAKKSRTMSWSSYPNSLYVGRTGTLSATASAGSSDGTISYSSSNSSKASVSGSTVTAVAPGTCTIYASISEGTNYLSASTSYTLTVNAIPSGFVDMGLPSGLFWAEKNIGASSIYTYECDFFSWGNTDGHAPTSSSSFSPYNWGTTNSSEPYKSSTGATLTANITNTNDAAYQNIGSPCRMPTASEFEELLNNVKYINSNGTEISSGTADKRVTVNGILGIYIESKINGNRLFFPCSGYGNSTAWNTRGTIGYYWSSTYYSSASCRRMYFDSGGVYPKYIDARYLGFAVRAVRA